MIIFLIGIVLFVPAVCFGGYITLRLKLAEMAKKDSLVTNGETGKIFGITKSKSSNDVHRFVGNLKGTGKHVEPHGKIEDGEKMVFGTFIEWLVYKFFGVFWIGLGGIYTFEIDMTDKNGIVITKKGCKFFSYNGERLLYFKNAEMEGLITGDFCIRYNDQITDVAQMIAFRWTTQTDQTVRPMFNNFAATRSVKELMGKQDAGVIDDGIKTGLDEVINNSNRLLAGKGIVVTQVIIEEKEIDPKVKEASDAVVREKLLGEGRIQKAEQDLKVQEVNNKQEIIKAETEAKRIKLINDALAKARRKKFNAVGKNPDAFVGAETAEAIKESKNLTTLAINSNTTLGIPARKDGGE